MCRINPDLSAKVRRDLEFFIPQMCSFYLTGYFKDADRMVNLFTKASQTDYHFSHRITFFLAAVLFPDKEKQDAQEANIQRVRKATLRQLGRITYQDKPGFKKEKIPYNERLFVANSQDLVRLLVMFNLSQFFPQLQGCAYVDYIKKSLKFKEDSIMKKEILAW